MITSQFLLTWLVVVIAAGGTQDKVAAVFALLAGRLAPGRA